MMEQHSFMTGMLLGGALVAAIPTLLVIVIGVYVLRQHRARARADATAGTTEEVSE